MTQKERQHLEHIKQRLTYATSALLSQDRSWGMALERIGDAVDEINEMLAAKPRGKKETT